VIVEEARSARDEVRAQLGKPQGLLRVSIETEIGPRLAGPVVADYLNHHPDVRIELDISPRRVDLIAEGFDIAVRIGSLPDSNLTVRKLAMLRAHLYASPKYIESHGEPQQPKELETHRRIHLFHKGDDGSWKLSRGRATVQIANSSLLSTNNMPMAKTFALEGLGIAAVDEMLAKDDEEAGRLFRVLPEWSLHSYPISVLTPSRLIPLKSRLFIDMLVAQIGATPGLRPS
jgi:DNA-binding transcriptional LysR family regulator